MFNRPWLMLAGALLGSTVAGVTSAALPTALGWSPLTGTTIRSVCAADNGFPNVGGNDGCPGITLAWSGGVFDTARNRMIVFGGGHQDYLGNEIYAISLDTGTIQRLTDPATPAGASTCQTSLAGGAQPNSRHTYDGIEYIPGLDKMFVFGGSLACSTGNFGQDTWLFDFATNTWKAMNPAGPIPDAIPGIVTAYDPNTGLIFLYDDLYFYSYNPSTNTYTKLNPNQQPIGYHLNATIDPKRKKFVMVGYDSVAGAGRVWTVDISAGSAYKLTQLATTGGSTVVSALYPGVEYDPVADRITAWTENSANVVYSLNMDTGAWTSVTYAGGPVAAGNGTHGRWRYSPKSNVFVLVNRVDDPAVIFRGSSASGGTADTTPPSTPSGVVASATSSSAINLSWGASTDNVGVTGYRVARCSGASCAPATVVATPTTTSYADSGLTASTSYSYSVVAVDAAGNASTASTVASATTQAASAGGGTGGGSGGTSADADFAARCAAPGVIKCEGFDNTTTDIVPNVTVFPDGAGTIRAFLDTTVKASGGGALRFDLPPPPHSGANIAGRWANEQTPVFGQSFGQNSTFYVQFRQRLSSEMVVDSWNGATWKNVIFHENNTTCGAIELTTSNYYGRALAQMNTDCGAMHMYTTLDGSAYNENPPLLQQQGDYMQCAYGATNPTNCFYWPANEWTTVYYKIHVGTWDQPNSTIEAWVAREGWTAYKQFIKVMNMTLSCNATVCNTAPGTQEGYNNVTFTPYMTGLPTTVGPSTVAHLWIDELIVSTQPIAVPGSKPKPSAPVLTVK